MQYSDDEGMRFHIVKPGSSPQARAFPEAKYMGIRRISKKRFTLTMLGLAFCTVILGISLKESYSLQSGIGIALFLSSMGTFVSAILHGFFLYIGAEMRRGRPKIKVINGRPFTYLPDSATLLNIFMFTIVSLLVVWGTITVAQLQVPGPRAILPATVAAIFGFVLFDLATGRIAVGYLALNAEGITQRGRGYKAFMAWDDVEEIVSHKSVKYGFVFLRETALGVTQKRTSWWPVDGGYKAGNWLLLDPIWSALPPSLYRDIVIFYLEHPEHRHELGTELAQRRFSQP